MFKKMIIGFLLISGITSIFANEKFDLRITDLNVQQFKALVKILKSEDVAKALNTYNLQANLNKYDLSLNDKKFSRLLYKYQLQNDEAVISNFAGNVLGIYLTYKVFQLMFNLLELPIKAIAADIASDF